MAVDWILEASSSWWVWVVAGFVLAIIEVMVPGFIFLGFAIGAIFTGILVGLGVFGANIAFLILVFSLASLAAWIVLHKTFAAKQGQNKRWETDIND